MAMAAVDLDNDRFELRSGFG